MTALPVPVEEGDKGTYRDEAGGARPGALADTRTLLNLLKGPSRFSLETLHHDRALAFPRGNHATVLQGHETRESAIRGQGH